MILDILLTFFTAISLAAVEPTEAAAWELRALGVCEPAQLQALRDAPKHRTVKLAIVGQSGVSAEVRISNGDLLTPLDRGPTDTEAISFIAPSHHANGPGGTCPAAGTAAACAAYLYAALKEKPKPAEVIARLRASSTIDQAAIQSAPEFDDAALETLRKRIHVLREPPPGKQRKLDAPGVLHLYRAFLDCQKPLEFAIKAVPEPAAGERSGGSSRSQPATLSSTSPANSP